jgi:hypothetical protein
MKTKHLFPFLIFSLTVLHGSWSTGWAYPSSYSWTKRIGGALDEWSKGIISDSSGNIYISGYFQGTVKFGNDFGAADTKTSAGDEDIYVTRINANGTYGWTRRLGGTQRDVSFDIAVDPLGNVYITGYFGGTVNFGADFGGTDIRKSAGSMDVFVTRINANGTYGWTRSWGGISGDSGNGITVCSNAIFVTGYFQDTVDFGAGFGTTDTKISAGYYDIFVTRINADSSYGWTKRMGGPSYDGALEITSGRSDNIYVAGYFNGTVDFGADFGTTDSLTCTESASIFVARISTGATYGGVKEIAGPTYQVVTDISTDIFENIYLTGEFMDTVNFGADFGKTDPKTSEGESDIFITKIYADGTYGWTRRMGGAQYDRGEAVVIDASGNVYVSGYFEGTVNFGADFGRTDKKVSAGEQDIFVTRINTAKGAYGGTKRMGGANRDFGTGAISDLSGNVYIIGEFEGTANFGLDFGLPDSKTSFGEQDVFVTKLTLSFPVFDGNDFDGNGTSDASIWRPSTGMWFIRDIENDAWGQLGDIPVSGDYDGDGTTDIAVWRPSNGRWYLRGMTGTTWGTFGDIPVPGDYDGDGITDFAVWRPSNGKWFILGTGTTVWGTAGDHPVPGDYDGDGDTDLAVWRPSNGKWYVLGISTTSWGTAGDFPVPGDYDKDEMTEIAVWRPSNGRWYVLGNPSASWGTIADIPVPGDYDGDGDTDLAVWRPSNGRWYFKDMAGFIWGILGDLPLVR